MPREASHDPAGAVALGIDDFILVIDRKNEVTDDKVVGGGGVV